MKAKEFVELFQLYPDAEVQIWDDSVGDITIKTTKDGQKIISLERKFEPTND